MIPGKCDTVLTIFEGKSGVLLNFSGVPAQKNSHLVLGYGEDPDGKQLKSPE
jgi:hypothetical protein